MLLLVDAHPDIVDDLIRSRALRGAVAEIPRLAELLRLNGNARVQFREKEGLLDAVRGNVALLREAEEQSDVWKLWVAHPELRVSGKALRSLRGKPKAVEFLTGHAGLFDADALGQALSRREVVALLESDEGFARAFVSTPEWQRMAAEPRFAEDVRSLLERAPEAASGAFGDPGTLRDVLRGHAGVVRGTGVAGGGGGVRGVGGGRSGAGSLSRTGDASGAAGSVAVGEVRVLGEVVSGEVVDLLVGPEGEVVGRVLAESPELLPVLLMWPRGALEIVNSPGGLARPSFERVFAEELRGVEGSCSGWVRRSSGLRLSSVLSVSSTRIWVWGAGFIRRFGRRLCTRGGMWPASDGLIGRRRRVCVRKGSLLSMS